MWPGSRRSPRRLEGCDACGRMIERIALDALALRAQLPELTLREGSSVVARVAAREAGHGVLVLAGVPLVAQLPPEVEAGQTLHLKVTEVTAGPGHAAARPAGDARRRAAAARPAAAAAHRRGAAAPRRVRRGRRHRGARVRLGRARADRPAGGPRARDRERGRRGAAGAAYELASEAAARLAGRARRSGPGAPPRCASRRAATRSTPMPEDRAASPRCATRAAARRRSSRPAAGTSPRGSSRPRRRRACRCARTRSWPRR